jgi:hypothetical protein
MHLKLIEIGPSATRRPTSQPPEPAAALVLRLRSTLRVLAASRNGSQHAGSCRQFYYS